MRRAWRRAAFAAMLVATLAGCVDIRMPEYEPVLVVLDDRNELEITTYPSWYPRQTSGIPYLTRTERTPESVYFQVYVKDRRQAAGPNPNVSSIRIESFSYRQAGRPPVVLIEHYDSYFWMQDNPNYNKRGTIPVPCVPGESITISIALVLNGKRHALTKQLTAVEHRDTKSLPLYVLGQ